MDWFETLTGFRETSYEASRRRLGVRGDLLYSTVNGASYATGELETPSVKELRERALTVLEHHRGTLRVSCVSGDARKMHRDPANENALFQVASQFNLLEMTGPSVTPEDGVTNYANDQTQGPACAIAAGAATIYRNYFADVGGHSGQTRQTQIDCLNDIGAALGNDGNALWTMRNGYAVCTEHGLAAIECQLSGFSPAEIGALRDLLRIGVHWNVEATEAPIPRHRLSQAFCSALPMSGMYTSVAAPRWRAFATLVLEGAYEATLWAAILNKQHSSSNVVFLTLLGGGAFGNDIAWILHAIARSLDMVKDVALDVRLVSYRTAPDGLVRLTRRY